MSMLIPHEGEVQLLNDLLAGGSLEAWTLFLFSSNTTPSEADTFATYTECTFTGYSSKTITRSVSGTTWSTPTQSGSVLETNCAKSTYGSSAQSWSATSNQSVYGYGLKGATSGKLIAVERFASVIALVTPSNLTLQPSLELAT